MKEPWVKTHNNFMLVDLFYSQNACVHCLVAFICFHLFHLLLKNSFNDRSMKVDCGWVRYDLFTFSFEQSKHFSFIFNYLCAR